MDLTTLATTVFGLVTPIITNKGIQEFSKTVWEKVKPLFIIEEKEIDELKKIKENPEKELYKKAFLNKLELLLDEKPELAKELEKLIEDAEENGDEPTKILIQNSKNVVTGNISNVTGNIHIGDKKS